MIAGHATLRDMQEWYTIDDVADLHEALDIEEDLIPDAPDQSGLGGLGGRGSRRVAR